MRTEWEAGFWPIDKDDIRARLRKAGATMLYAERVMPRMNFFPPGGDTVHHFARIRDEGHRITMTVKDMSGTRMEEQKEAEVVVEDFEKAREVLLALGCRDKNYQEAKRELWELDGTEVTIDEWPFLEPLSEIEGESEETVRKVAEKLGFDWSRAYFCSADKLYAEKYGVDPRTVTELPRLTFDIDNPFQKQG